VNAGSGVLKCCYNLTSSHSHHASTVQKSFLKVSQLVSIMLMPRNQSEVDKHTQINNRMKAEWWDCNGIIG
jgi:hypothetical protein